MTGSSQPFTTPPCNDTGTPAAADPSVALTLGGTANWVDSVNPWLAAPGEQVFLMQQHGGDLQLHLMTQDASGRVHDAGFGPVVTITGVSLTDLNDLNDLI